jgi:hypothetical protein
MKPKSMTLKRLLRLYRAARTLVDTENDRRPRINLVKMSKRFVFITTQGHRGLTGSLINIDVFVRMMGIGRGIVVAGGATALIACCLVAFHSVDAAIRAAAVLLVCGCFVWYRVLEDIKTLLNFDNLVEFMEFIDLAGTLLNPPGEKDPLKWLRYSQDDLSANAANVVEATLEKHQLDEVKRQIELFVTLGLVTGQPLNKFKQRLTTALEATASSVPVSA